MQVLAYIIFALVLYRIIVMYRRHKNYYRTKAIVVDNEVVTINDPLQGDKYFYHPIVQYTDVAGEQHTLVSDDDNQGRPVYQPGDSITILVHPNKDGRFMIQNVIDTYVNPIIWLAVGIFLLVVTQME
jgi:hypothetical protein